MLAPWLKALISIPLTLSSSLRKYHITFTLSDNLELARSFLTFFLPVYKWCHSKQPRLFFKLIISSNQMLRLAYRKFPAVPICELHLKRSNDLPYWVILKKKPFTVNAKAIFNCFAVLQEHLCFFSSFNLNQLYLCSCTFTRFAHPVTPTYNYRLICQLCSFNIFFQVPEVFEIICWPTSAPYNMGVERGGEGSKNWKIIKFMRFKMWTQKKHGIL